jgi:hypothetical protein
MYSRVGKGGGVLSKKYLRDRMQTIFRGSYEYHT